MSAAVVTRAYVALGANLGEPVKHLRAAVDDLGTLPGTQVTARSSLYRSAPVGLLNQPDFINAVVAVDTPLPALELLRQLLTIEARHGRVRSVPNAPRTLDLDLLLYGELQMQETELTLPHPRMHQRAFVLLPLLEIAPDLILPALGPGRDFLPGVADQTISRSEPL
ncbi:2-amino-4-hydroxy-6-hydroxymethyldihydropteridine diphosphokinase [Zoogloea sp. LCSB751]|uniref:2-amino-4-hydroxy-6- hydroxymethyldihydropteridine diphosphokinase n=1 Tax=Zoogloea sp. LCSB751 TaxID=1965277 RepID=UPI0009A48FBF|nr:2-amino-4-hydroxy-6-hydroxymethyldihydropteridine diphosphokinase [Zoogloea sp. LCSB751]